jgi:hypothetical protein
MAVVRCPVCRANVDGASQCRRCRADLAMVVAAEDHRQQLVDSARRAAATGDLARALDFADRADRLRPDDDTRRLRAVLALLRRDFSSAWQAYCRLAPGHRTDR